MTFLEIQQDVWRRLNKGSSSVTPDALTVERIKAFINTTYRELLSEAGLSNVATEVNMTLTSVASQQRYGLAGAIDRIHRIYDPTNRIPLEERSLSWLRVNDPGTTTITGTPVAYVPIGYTGVFKQTAPAATPHVQSTAAGDTQTARITGVSATGMPATSSATMTGTTAVVMSGIWLEVDTFSLSSPAVGEVTLHQTVPGAATEMARIAVGKTASEYFTILLWPTPSGIVTYNLDYQRKVITLINSDDTPVLPERFHDALVYGACIHEAGKLDDDRVAYFERLLDQSIAKLRYWTASRPGQRWTPNVRRVAHSTLGGFFPPDN